MNNMSTERDWLFALQPDQAFTTAVNFPPGPISGEIEERYDPVFLLSNYRDEARWSATIAEWGREHFLFIDADEE